MIPQPTTPLHDLSAPTQPCATVPGSGVRRRPASVLEVDELPRNEQLKCVLYWLSDGLEPMRSYRKLEDGRVLVECIAGRFHFGPFLCSHLSEAEQWLFDAANEAADAK